MLHDYYINILKHYLLLNIWGKISPCQNVRLTLHKGTVSSYLCGMNWGTVPALIPLKFSLTYETDWKGVKARVKDNVAWSIVLSIVPDFKAQYAITKYLCRLFRDLILFHITTFLSGLGASSYTWLWRETSVNQNTSQLLRRILHVQVLQADYLSLNYSSLLYV